MYCETLSFIKAFFFAGENQKQGLGYNELRLVGNTNRQTRSSQPRASTNVSDVPISSRANQSGSDSFSELADRLR